MTLQKQNFPLRGEWGNRSPLTLPLGLAALVMPSSSDPPTTTSLASLGHCDSTSPLQGRTSLRPIKLLQPEWN